jgi:hypothetical protein
LLALSCPRRAEGAPASGAAVPPAGAEASAAQGRPDRAHVVLVGEAGRGEELSAVLSELLTRQNVVPDFERRERFRSNALLEESTGDSRVWVFVTRPSPHVARLYFRGPHGNRFLLRELALKNGLDELGRELIAQVVETSTVALLRSEAGLSREEASRDLSLQGEPQEGGDDIPVVAALPPSAQSAEPPGDANDGAPTARGGPSRFTYELSARLAEKWAGSDFSIDTGVGAETGLAYGLSPSLFVRGRLVFEYGLGQSIETASVNADVQTSALRLGVDLGTRRGPHGFAAGVSAGADVTRVQPAQPPDASLAPAARFTDTTPVVRLEARYELALGAFRATAGVLGDVSLEDTHYDVRIGDGSTPVAEPWAVRPGLALTVGWCPPL